MPLLRITDLKNPDVDYKSSPKVQISNKDLKAFKVEINDFLIGRSGAIGRYGIWSHDEDAVFASYLIRFRFSESQLDTRYFGVVLEGITIGGKSLREHFEAINHREAITYVESIVSGEEPLSEWQIQNIHQLVLKNIDDQNAGRCRQQNVVIAGASHTPPNFLQLPQAMTALITWYQNAAADHPLLRAARLHVDFVGIHPFVDGNGRTARLLMNFELMRCGYLPVIIRVERRLAYYDALDTAHTTQNYEPFLQLIAEQERAALHHYLSIIQGDY